MEGVFGAAAVIGFREALEAVIIVLVVLGVLRAAGRRAGLTVFSAVAAAVGLGILAALVAFPAVVAASGNWLVETAAYALAAGVVLWVAVWSSSHAKKAVEELKRAAQASGRILWIAVFIYVGREVLEVLAMSAPLVSSSLQATIAGLLAGIGAAAVIGVIAYLASLRIPLKAFFTALSIALVGIGAWLAGEAVAEAAENALTFIPGEDAAFAVAAAGYALATGYLVARNLL